MFKEGFLNFLRFNLCHFLFRVKTINLDKALSVDKAVVCPNHSHSFDPFWVYLRIPNMWIMAKAELFENKIFSWLAKIYNVFPIHRGAKDAKSLIHAINAIKKNDHAKLLIFPEGTRIKKDKERGRAKVGPVYIAGKAGVPLIPTYITKNPKIFHKVYVVYGDPIYLPDDILEDKQKIQEYSDLLLDKCYALKDEIEKSKQAKIDAKKAKKEAKKNK